MVIALLGFVGTSLEGRALSRFMSAVTVSAVRNVADNKQGALSPYGVTSLFYLGVMKHVSPNLSYSLESVLRCPRRFHLERVRRERVLAPFASSVLGRAVHQRIAASLRRDEPADERTFRLPKRLLLQRGETLGDLTWRAQNALAFFNAKCRAWLGEQRVSHLEHLIEHRVEYRVEYHVARPSALEGETVQVSGIFDLIFTSVKGDVLIDWKTGSAQRSADQLRFYLGLRFLETGRAPRQAEAVGLSAGDSLYVEWDETLPRWFEGRLERLKRDLGACHTRKAVPGRHCTYCPYAQGCDVSEATDRYLLDTRTGEVTGGGGDV